MQYRGGTVFTLLNHSFDWNRLYRANICGLQNRDDVDCLRIDFKCLGCGYNLRSANIKGDCSECGTAVRESLSSKNFMFSDEKWRRALATGMLMFAIFPMIRQLYESILGIWKPSAEGIGYPGSPAGFNGSLMINCKTLFIIKI